MLVTIYWRQLKQLVTMRRQTSNISKIIIILIPFFLMHNFCPDLPVSSHLCLHHQSRIYHSFSAQTVLWNSHGSGSCNYLYKCRIQGDRGLLSLSTQYWDATAKSVSPQFAFGYEKSVCFVVIKSNCIDSERQGSVFPFIRIVFFLEAII